MSTKSSQLIGIKLACSDPQTVITDEMEVENEEALVECMQNIAETITKLFNACAP